MPSTARKRIRRYLARAAKDYPHLPEISRFPGTEISLTVPDLQTLLQSEKEARATATTLSGKAAEAARVVAVLQQENTDLRNNVSDLARKISDPPGSAERWQALRADNASLAAQRDSLQTSLAQAETQIRTQAGTIEQQARALQEEWARRDRDAQEQRDRANRAETEVARQAELLREAHKDAERLETAAASVPALRKLVEDRGRSIRDLSADRDRWKRTAEAWRKPAPRTYADVLRAWDHVSNTENVAKLLRAAAEFLK